MKSVLVTGGSGFIGRHLISALKLDGATVRATARTTSAGHALAGLGAEVVQWSMEDKGFPAGHLAGIDTCFHLAAPRRTFDPQRQSNHRPGDPALVNGSQSLAAAIVQSDVTRLIVTSSVAVHGNCWGEVDEASPVSPEGAYARNRRDVETLFRKTLSATPARLVIARLTETFGPGSPGQIGILTAISAGRFRIIGTGQVLHHLSAVEDVVSGLLALGRSKNSEGMTLNIGSPPRTFRAFVAAAAAETGQPLRETPWAGPPATALLRLFRSSGAASRHAARLYTLLDYQLRPRAYLIRQSIEVLGNYATTDFEAAVAASARAAMARRRA